MRNDPEFGSCTLCSDHSDPNNTCSKCGLPFCRECFCRCDHITEQHALAVALQVLWRTPPTPSETLLVEDEYGVCYAHLGSGDCFLQVPMLETEFLEVSILLDEFSGGKHDAARQVALADGCASYGTAHYIVAVKKFTIQGRLFTASVFGRKQ